MAQPTPPRPRSRLARKALKAARTIAQHCRSRNRVDARTFDKIKRIAITTLMLGIGSWLVAWASQTLPTPTISTALRPSACC